MTLAAVDQFLNDDFYQNPAELSVINHSQITAGNIWINPVVSFAGTAYGATGTANTNVVDYLPYVLSAYRVKENLVVGFNATPSGYGHLEWPVDSFVSPASTTTNVRYYRYGFQASYQINHDLAVGMGFNLEENAKYQINFVIPGQGNQVNSITGLNYTGDFGLYYKINLKTYITLASYTQVNTYGYGNSSIGSTVNHNLSFNITEAPIVYVGIKRFQTDQWFLEGKIYWSGWSIQKNLDFTNTTTGSYSIPTNWKDVWSFQITTRYALKEKIAVVGSIIYETNPVPLATNAIGYPLAASGALSGGLDLNLTTNLSFQAIYSYGAFLPNAPISNANSNGTINSHFQAGVIQFSYKT